jgi:hypothetical protein
MARGANISIVSNEPDSALVIKDEGPWDKYFTVTNDVENVVALLRLRGFLPDGRRLFYYDSEGVKDEILIEKGAFAGFKSGV